MECKGKRKIEIGRVDIVLKCQLGSHRSGDCRMALQEGIIVIFKPEDGGNG